MLLLVINFLVLWFLLKVDIIFIVCELLLYVCFFCFYRIDKIFCIFVSLWSNYIICFYDFFGVNCCRLMVGGGYVMKCLFYGCFNLRGVSKFWNNI